MFLGVSSCWQQCKTGLWKVQSYSYTLLSAHQMIAHTITSVWFLLFVLCGKVNCVPSMCILFKRIFQKMVDPLKIKKKNRRTWILVCLRTRFGVTYLLHARTCTVLHDTLLHSHLRTGVHYWCKPHQYKELQPSVRLKAKKDSVWRKHVWRNWIFFNI